MKPTVADILDERHTHALDAWVAEYVLGYRWQIYPWSHGKNRKRYLAGPGDQVPGAQLARGDEPQVGTEHYRTTFLWTHDIGHAWQVIEAVRKWPEERQLRFLSALTMQNEGSAHPLAWLAFSARFPAVALCRAALVASVGCNAPVSANVE
jgi:hypothetical protein